MSSSPPAAAAAPLVSSAAPDDAALGHLKAPVRHHGSYPIRVFLEIVPRALSLLEAGDVPVPTRDVGELLRARRRSDRVEHRRVARRRREAEKITQLLSGLKSLLINFYLPSDVGVVGEVVVERGEAGVRLQVLELSHNYRLLAN